MTLRVGSLFSGCGGIDLGLHRAGLSIAWHCEIESKPVSVLRRHWPGSQICRDVRDISTEAAVLVGGEHDGSETRWRPEPVDVLAGGFPCQDLSVAGHRRGLAGRRSGLFYEFVRIAGVLSPRWILLENVPGLLSSNGGRDMGAVVGALVKLGYGVAWRVLDSRYFRVPQRRRRVFIVGCAGADARRAASVLFESDRLPWDSPESREAREDSACGPLTSSGGGGRGHRCGVDEVAGGQLVAATGVRRLTPRECERLQAFPDDWTRWSDDGGELADGPRYAMIGNAVTVSVAEWIGRRIAEAS